MKMTDHQNDLLRYAMIPISKVDRGATVRAIEGAPALPAGHFVFVWVHGGVIEAHFPHVDSLRGIASDVELSEIRRRVAVGDILLTIEVEGQKQATVWLPVAPAASA